MLVLPLVLTSWMALAAGIEGSATSSSARLDQRSPPDMEPSSGATASRFDDFERRPVVLSDEEFEYIKKQILTRCQAATKSTTSELPWHFHYELALAMIERGDPQRALDALIQAVDRRAGSQSAARMYGVWFIDYTPYVKIAQMHALLGNWSCAADALRLSQEQNEILPGNRNSHAFEELKQELAKHQR